MQDARISFRANSAVQAELALRSKKTGLSISRIVRDAVEAHVSDGPFFVALNEVDPFSKLSEAARGDLQAQRELASHAVGVAFASDARGNALRDPVRALHEGLIFARLAAAHGQVQDRRLVHSMASLIHNLEPEDVSLAQVDSREDPKIISLRSTKTQH